MEDEAASGQGETELTGRERSFGDVSGSILRFLLSDEGGAESTEAAEAEVDAGLNSSEAQQNKINMESERGMLPRNSGSIQVLRPKE